MLVNIFFNGVAHRNLVWQSQYESKLKTNRQTSMLFRGQEKGYFSLFVSKKIGLH
jgi:hypothetical protein